MKKTTKVITTLIFAVCITMPVAVQAGEKNTHEVSFFSYLATLFSPSPDAKVVRPNKTKK